MGKLVRRALAFLLCMALLAGMVPAFAADGEYSTDVYLRSTVEIMEISKDIAIGEGDSATLEVVAQGAGLTYSWEVSADGGANWAPASGTRDQASYFIEHAQANTPKTLPYLYRITIKDSFGETASEVIRVLVNNDYEYGTRTDSAGGVEVTGFLHKTARLVVELVQTEITPTSLQAMVREGYAPLAAYEVYLHIAEGVELPAIGKVDITFTVDSIYNGQTLNVYHQKSSGVIETLTGTVASNKLTVTAEELSPFLIEVEASTLFSVTATSGAGGDISPAGKVYVPAGGDKTFVFTPHAGYVLDTVKVDGKYVVVTGNRYTLTNIREDHTLHATFKRPSRPPSRPPSGGSGDDKPAYVINIPAAANGHTSPSGTITKSYGDSLTIYFYPDKGYEVDRVLVNGIEVSPGSNSYTFTVTGDADVAVSFKEKTVTPTIVTRTISATAGSHGKVSPAGTTTVNDGGDLYVYFIPDDGYEVCDVTVDGIKVEAGSYWHFINVRANHAIHVTFREKGDAPVTGPSGSESEPAGGHDSEYAVISIQIDGDENGRVSPSGEISVAAGGSQTFYFYPNEGYEIGRVLIDGVEVDASAGYYTMENVTGGNHTVTAVFQPAGSAAGSACTCVICGFWRMLFPGMNCVCPWCWLLPLLILLAAAAAGYALWRRARKKTKQETSDQPHENT